MPKKKVKSKKPKKKAVKTTKKPVKKSKLKIQRKKVSVKKVRYVIEPVPDEYIFHVHDGGILRNLTDLIHSLEVMAEDIFYHHANDNRNDFSNWIRDVIDEPELSMNICGKNQHDTKREIVNYLRKRGTFKG